MPWKQIGILSPVRLASPTWRCMADGVLYQDTGTSTPATANNDPVGNWPDQLGILNLTESTNKPTLKTNVLNGRPVIDFNGTTQRLTNASGLAQGDFTVIAIARTTTTAADRSLVGWGNIATNQQGRVLHCRPTGTRAFVGINADRDSTSNWVANTWSLWTVTGSGVPTSGSATTTISHRVNGASAGSGTTTAQLTAFASNAVWVGSPSGGTTYWSGQVAEIVQFSSVLTAAQIVAWENYLNSKWAVY